MVAIPQTTDPTLDAVNAAIEVRGNAEKARPYLGMSGIGRECRRQIWYDFRWCSESTFDAATLRRFEDGHRTEDLEADRLRLVEGIELITTDPRTGNQIGFVDIGGHFRGHADGAIKGLIQAPAAWHCWEHKATNDKKQAELAKLKADKGEKDALRHWDPVYFGQGVLYMHYSGMARHYLTCSTPGGRHTISVRTNANEQAALALIEKARQIIQSPEPLERLSESPEFYKCKWCQHQAVCHASDNAPALPQVNCRTCAHATPETDGDGRWSCARYKCDITVEQQRAGCTDHIYIPAMTPWEAIDSLPDEGAIEYKKPDGMTFWNGPGHWSSKELHAAPGIAGDPGADAIKKPLAGNGLPQSQNSQGQDMPWLRADPAATSSQTEQESEHAPWKATA